MIALLTDFGDTDPFVGVMKGVMLGINPELTIVDLTHGIEPQDIGQAAFILKTSLSYFPPGTLFVVVVDPGVGGSRKIVYVRCEKVEFLAPDNGVLYPSLQHHRPLRIIEVKNTDYFLKPVSRTFHGRDIFAPVAAHLSRGLKPEFLGDPLSPEDLGKGSFPQPYQDPEGIWHGEVVHIDRFGNLITNFSQSQIHLKDNARLELEIKNVKIQNIAKNYEAGEGKPAVLMNSFDTLEIVLAQGSAAEFFKIKKGERVRLTCRMSSC